MVRICIDMRRVRFVKVGGQREFIDLVIQRLDSPSLRGLLQFGFDVLYSTLRNYYTGKRLLPEDLFIDMCELARIEPNSLGVEYIKGAWGQKKGGVKSKRGKSLKMRQG